MTGKEIKTHLLHVFVRLLACMPEELAKALSNDSFFAGGCIVNCVQDIPVVDYDLFIRTEKAKDLLLSYFEQLAGTYDTTAFMMLSRTENATTLKLNGGEVVQIVTRFWGDTDRIFKDFDFTHCKSYYDPSRDALVYNEELILKKQLRYDGEKDMYTLNTLKRLCKFVSRGWVPDNGTIINLHRAIQNRPHIDSPEERKLQGVGFYGSSFT